MSYRNIENGSAYYGFDFDEESRMIQDSPEDSGAIPRAGSALGAGGMGVEAGKRSIGRSEVGKGSTGRSEAGEKRRKSRVLVAVLAALAALLIVGIGVIGGYGYTHKAVHVSDILVSPGQLTIEEEEVAQVQIGIYPAKTTDKIVVESSDPTLLAVTAGEIIPGETQMVNVTGIAPGTAEIVVKGGKREESIRVTIEKKVIPVEDIELTIGGTELYVGNKLQIVRKAVVKPEDATEQTITYKSSDESILVIGQDGVGTGISPGTVTVTVSAGDFSKELVVTVEQAPQQTTASPDSGSSGKAKSGSGAASSSGKGKSSGGKSSSGGSSNTGGGGQSSGGGGGQSSGGGGGQSSGGGGGQSSGGDSSSGSPSGKGGSGWT